MADEVVMLRVRHGGRHGIRCLACGLTSWNPNDVEQLYCGHCHQYGKTTDATEMTQEQAESIPWEVRVAAYAHEQHLAPNEALAELAELAELGLRKVLEDRMLADLAYEVPYYLWPSMKALMAEAHRG